MGPLIHQDSITENKNCQTISLAGAFIKNQEEIKAYGKTKNEKINTNYVRLKMETRGVLPVKMYAFVFNGWKREIVEWFIPRYSTDKQIALNSKGLPAFSFVFCTVCPTVHCDCCGFVISLDNYFMPFSVRQIIADEKGLCFIAVPHFKAQSKPPVRQRQINILALSFIVFINQETIFVIRLKMKC